MTHVVLQSTGYMLGFCIGALEKQTFHNVRTSIMVVGASQTHHSCALLQVRPTMLVDR